MKKTITTLLLTALVGAGSSFAQSDAPAQARKDSAAKPEKAEEIAGALANANPKQACLIYSAAAEGVASKKVELLLPLVQSLVSTNSKCACEIVKGAIAGVSDKNLVEDIVVAAITAAPQEASNVAECAVAAAPEQSVKIRAALKGALSDKNPVGSSEKNPVVSSKNPGMGKNVGTTEKTTDDDDYILGPVNIGGIYLIAPSTGGGGAGQSRLVIRNGKVYIVQPDGTLIRQDEKIVEKIRNRNPSNRVETPVDPSPTRN